jgi:hypothetical protein
MKEAIRNASMIYRVTPLNTYTEVINGLSTGIYGTIQIKIAMGIYRAKHI